MRCAYDSQHVSSLLHWNNYSVNCYVFLGAYSMNLDRATIEQLLEAERIAIKFSPNAVVSIAKTYYRRLVKPIMNV